MLVCDSRSKPDPKPLLGRRARRAIPRSLPWSRVKKLTTASASRKGQVCRTKASLTRADIYIDTVWRDDGGISRLSREGVWGGVLGLEKGFEKTYPIWGGAGVKRRFEKTEPIWRVAAGADGC